jgi:entericidin B
MRSLILYTVLFGLTMITTACNTFEGFGQDVQAGGKKIERAADRNK